MPEHAERRVSHFVGLGDQSASQGDHADAHDNYTKALDAAREEYGLQGSKLVPILQKVIDSTLKDRLLSVEKRVERAAYYYRWVLACQEAQLGFEHSDLAATLKTLAIFYDQLGRHTEACELIERLKAIPKHQ
jgi:tetratricopeptide (TPR) repeat protein